MEYPMKETRFEHQIRALEARCAEKGGVLLYGSSFFANWGYDRAREQLAAASGGKLRITNHGFGGAFVDELLRYYDRLVKPCCPGMGVLRPAYNDLANGIKAEDCLLLTKLLTAWLELDFPEAKIVILKVFDTRAAGFTAFQEMVRYNAMLDGITGGKVYTLDLNPFFYDDPKDIGTRQHFRDVFLDDGLHLTDRGYEEMAVYLAAELQKL